MRLRRELMAGARDQIFITTSSHSAMDDMKGPTSCEILRWTDIDCGGLTVHRSTCTHRDAACRDAHLIYDDDDHLLPPDIQPSPPAAATRYRDIEIAVDRTIRRPSCLLKRAAAARMDARFCGQGAARNILLLGGRLGKVAIPHAIALPIQQPAIISGQPAAAQQSFAPDLARTMVAANGPLRPWPIFLLAFCGACLFVVNIILLTGVDVRGQVSKILVRPRPVYHVPPDAIDENEALPDEIDRHPIVALTHEQLKKFQKYKWSQSTSFSQVVAKYRLKYGRHPPPKFDEWYRFARKRKCVNLDDFDQIMDDLRPFYGVPPAEIRAMVRAMDTPDSRVSILRVRNHKVVDTLRADAWRANIFAQMLGVFAEHLPDLDIAMNYLDEPRVVVPWEDVQAKLAIEQKGRKQPPETTNDFSKMDWDKAPKEEVDCGFFDFSGMAYMDVAAKGCPPDSYARRPELDIKRTESTYKDPISGFIRDFNRSADLCTIGPTLAKLHGFLFSSSTTVTTQKLVPIFGECKVNVNNDILFPANKYYDLADTRYLYDDSNDVPWHEKVDQMVWRGVTSGGVQNAATYMNLQRHRFVAMTNATKLGNDTTYTIMEAASADNADGVYTPAYFHPSAFAEVRTDVAFSEILWCVPNCEFLADKLSTRPGLPFKDTFKFKYLVDIDGHSFSGRWHAFLKSHSMGIKATIFKEWHDQRLFEWVHFAPMDNRYDDLYALLTYFMGLEKGATGSDGAYVPRHDTEAKRIADRSREWATQVLRKEDVEIYMMRLILEYARVVDDNRDNIGYSGDGSEVDAEEKEGWWGRQQR
ncbi:Beta-1,2-xylosyltransferase [Drechslerella dactyloides]|uniref:Beta-1,2-xylosyltransferase n=1 Tax=Drechslerella dactyloides TaxID=74499 RepID=A0AAD6NKL8_DREDA|nr:Beta-1,2-xylosyltransferase [Drechslerella dactyloides]